MPLAKKTYMKIALGEVFEVETPEEPEG